MTKNPNPGLLMFSFLVLCEVGGGGGEGGLDRARGGVG